MTNEKLNIEAVILALAKCEIIPVKCEPCIKLADAIKAIGELLE